MQVSSEVNLIYNQHPATGKMSLLLFPVLRLFMWTYTEINRGACLHPNRDTSVSRRRLFSSIRIALTSHGTKSNSVLSLNELAGEAARLDCIWGMLIRRESGSGDVVIKDSISQRSVWCDHILPLTDGVSLTSALWRHGCHKRRRQNLLTWKRESGGCVGLNIPVRVENSFSHGVLK